MRRLAVCARGLRAPLRRSALSGVRRAKLHSLAIDARAVSPDALIQQAVDKLQREGAVVLHNIFGDDALEHLRLHAATLPRGSYSSLDLEDERHEQLRTLFTEDAAYLDIIARYFLAVHPITLQQQRLPAQAQDERLLLKAAVEASDVRVLDNSVHFANGLFADTASWHKDVMADPPVVIEDDPTDPDAKPRTPEQREAERQQIVNDRAARSVTVIAPIDTFAVDNGPTELILRSHTSILPPDVVKRVLELGPERSADDTRALVEPHGARVVCFLASPGSALLFRRDVLHRAAVPPAYLEQQAANASQPSRLPRRLAAITRYIHGPGVTILDKEAAKAAAAAAAAAEGLPNGAQ